MAPVDACGALIANPIGGLFYNSVAAVEQCYNTFKASSQDRKMQVDALKSYLNFYPYNDIVKGVSAPYYPMQMDLFKELDAVTTNAGITTEYQLQNAIGAVLGKLKDGHVSYNPLCFQSFIYYQPFRLAAKYNDQDGAPEIYAQTLVKNPADPIWTYWNKTFSATGVSNTDFLGATVKSINGQNTVDFLQKFADDYSSAAHAPETRFNQLFPTYQWPNSNGYYTFAFPIQFAAREPIKYEFQLYNSTVTKTVTFDWAGFLATNPANYANAQTYYETECIPQPPPPPPAGPADKARLVEPTPKSMMELDEFVQPVAAGLAQDKTVVVSGSENGAFLMMMSDNKTGVWMLSTFLPNGLREATSEADFFKVLDSWFLSVTDGLAALEKAGATRLIIDVTNNGGGLVCSGFRFANYLFPNANIKQHVYQARMTQPLADVLLFSNEIANEFAGSLKTLSGNNITDYLNQLILPGAKLPGYPHQYSNKATLDPNGCSPMPEGVKLQGKWKAEDILLVSNGFCGSTCAQFTTILRDQVGVRAVTYGGGFKRSTPKSKSFDPTAFAAGNVLPFEAFLGLFSAVPPSAFTDHKVTLPASGQDPEDSRLPVPFRFPLHPGSQMPFLTATSPKPKIQDSLPIEWVIDASDFYLKNVNLGNPESVWNAVVDGMYFESKPAATTTTTAAAAASTTTVAASATASAVSTDAATAYGTVVRPVADGYVAPGPKNLYSSASMLSVGTILAFLSLLAL
ncbi:hypothetical protein BDR26DRAFT_875542 [Obelidium mucronatum]|nr:hypothetical protein BDR26DRAFT_875542 [Obelidium mucronatum]